MKIQDEHSIEPLSDATWQRIEARLFERVVPLAPAPRRRSQVRALAPWALAAAVVLLGTVTFQRLAPMSATHPPAAQSFSTGATAQSFALPDVTLQLDPHSSLVVARGTGSAVLCTLSRGAVRFDVVPRAGREPLAVVAGDVRVEVLGTIFRVAHAGAAVSVETYEGTVRVSARGESVLLRRGERWPSGPEPRSEAAQAAHGPGGLAKSPPVESPPVESRPVESQPLEPGRRATRGASPRERYEEAAASEASDYKKALQLYEQLAREPGAWGSNGLFALGRLELEHGLPQQSAPHLRRYLRLHPNGANAADARALLAQILRERCASRVGAMKPARRRRARAYALTLALTGCTETVRLTSAMREGQRDAVQVSTSGEGGVQEPAAGSGAPEHVATEDKPEAGAAPLPDAAPTRMPPMACSGPLFDEQTLSLAVTSDPCTSLAARTFRQGLCSCDVMSLLAGLTADSFDSSLGASAPVQRGLGIGSNGSFEARGTFDVLGTLSAAGPTATLSQGQFHVAGNLYVGGDLILNEADAVFGRELWVAGNVTSQASVARVAGSAYQAPGRTGANAISTASGVVSEALTVEEPCTCSGPLGVDFIRLRQRFVGENDNTAAGLAATALTDRALIELPACGRYFLDGGGSAAAVWRAPGQAALFIDHDLEVIDRLEVDTGDHGVLDVFVRGALRMQPGARIETARPGALRIYVSALSTLELTQGASIQASVYAPRATLTVTEEQTFTGALLVAALTAAAPVHLHFDRAVLAPAATASTCTSASCSRDRDCAPPLLCESAQCRLTEP